MINVILLTISMTSGIPEQRSQYDALCLSPTKTPLEGYDCTLTNRDISPDPKTCKNFSVKEVHVTNVKHLNATLIATCREFFDGNMELDVKLKSDEREPKITEQSTIKVFDVPEEYPAIEPKDQEPLRMKYDDESTTI